MRLTLRVQLTALYAAVFGLLFVAFSWMSYRVLAARLDDDATAHLAELAEGLHGFVRVQDDEPAIVFDPNDASQAAFIHEATQYYRIADGRTGLLLTDSTGFRLLGLLETPADVLRSRNGPTVFDITTEQGRFRISTSAGSTPPNHAYVLQVGVSLDPMDATLDRYRDLLLWRIPIVLLAAALAAWWMSRFALRPLTRAAAAAETIDISNLSARLPRRGANDELDDLTGAFNETLDRLERAVGDMRQFSTALAHELRTPLSSLRGELELELGRAGTNETRRQAIVSQLEELDRLKRLIDQILTLARAEAGQIRLSFAPVDLGALGAALVDQLLPVAEARGVDLTHEHSGAVVVEGDAGWLERLILNLLDNALKFTPAGGRVVLRVSERDRGAVIEVRDTGVGMSADVTPHIFDRFFRADPSRSSSAEGAGLGLSLVQWIAERHGGRVHVESRPGHGSLLAVWVPAKRA